MRFVWLSLAVVFLLGSFICLGFDFYQFFQSSGTQNALRVGSLWPQSMIESLSAWKLMQGSTWGNINRLLLWPILVVQPLWLACLLLSILLRLLGRKPA